MSELGSVAAFIGNRLWAVERGTFRGLATAEARADLQARDMTAPAPSAGVAVIPVRGVLTQRNGNGLFDLLFGGSTYEQIVAMAQEADRMPEVDRILFDFDTPGGDVRGLEQAVAGLKTISKPKVGIANGLASSAGYWLLSQMDEVIAAPGSSMGSIGVLYVHLDMSGANEKMGIKETVIGEPEAKAEAFGEELTETVRAHMAHQAGELYGRFVSAVAKGRGVAPAKVRSDFGQGLTLLDNQAVAAGMADRTATFAETVDRLSNRRRPVGRRPRAAAAAIRAATGVWS